ncbi:MAG: cytochrome c [Gemmatimonadales bacterium]|nr:MAG: cytochrome c [Gemmatimonadales bacterium]
MAHRLPMLWPMLPHRSNLQRNRQAGRWSMRPCAGHATASPVGEMGLPSNPVRYLPHAISKPGFCQAPRFGKSRQISRRRSVGWIRVIPIWPMSSPSWISQPSHWPWAISRLLTYPPEFTVGSAIAGHRNYLLRCQGCHGPGGRGDGPGAEVLNPTPANFTQDTLLAARNFQAAFDKIRLGGGGVHGSAMPAWGVMLDDGDVWDLVAYISTFQPGVLSVPPTQGR